MITRTIRQTHKTWQKRQFVLMFHASATNVFTQNASEMNSSAQRALVCIIESPRAFPMITSNGCRIPSLYTPCKNFGTLFMLPPIFQVSRKPTNPHSQTRFPTYGSPSGLWGPSTRGNRGVREHHPDNPEATTQKVRDGFFQLESRGSMKSAQQTKTTATRRISTPQPKRNLEQNTTDFLSRDKETTGAHDCKGTKNGGCPIASSTMTRPSMSQFRSNAEKTPQRHHEDCMTKHNEIQMDKKLHST